ncbi:hypothetical protein ASPZODRAFT_127526 [Penicilliopsis zonata CBS 506.65]|uniref:Fork-head domain-containing protein n=1 Tax=Penicilliopsis zonata CBS 506.65 TaxID=1073090 RepID=A0A1L9SW88_9EURO|nr:hypothetical protein ASPZODRAFT_127526 [Penicilliopsis zonata CBS 506.65]OJJ51458.1 hypothetical protein ASPZODRAFT_127526 [Penicilliopsis zonata CBS 506.65]
MSMYDYGGLQPDDDRASPRSTSAIRDLHNSASDLPATPPRCFREIPGMVDVKTEPRDDGNMGASGGRRDDASRQSAASALLAQLLGNHPSDDGPAAPADGSGIKQLEDAPHLPENPASLNDDCLMVDHRPAAEWEQPGEPPNQHQPTSTVPYQGGQEEEKRIEDGLFDGQNDQESGSHDVSKALESSVAALEDPLMAKTTHLEDSDIFASFDLTQAPRGSLAELQQNDLLTAAYLSQSADLSALGYSHGQLVHDGASSIAGSEPRIQAFAKLEFDDGHFYVNTYSFILGRDVRAARAAHQREAHARQAIRHSRAMSSSGGNTSHTPIRVKREESALIGSVVSDRGGIMGFDPDVPTHLPPKLSRRSSNSSFAEAPLHATPAQLQSTDYNALAMQSLNDSSRDAKPVDTLALLPSPDACPTIPIHPPATLDGSAAGHRGISRKHVRICYNFDKNLFEMEVMGRNGAFIGADWLSPGQIRPLHSGDYIQIGGVRIRFLLPDVPIGETGADRMEESFLGDETDGNNAQSSVGAEYQQGSGAERVSQGPENKDSPSSKPNNGNNNNNKLILKSPSKESDQTNPLLPSIELLENNGQQPARRRGPGRPPKDGIMSKRERAELAREQKLAARREANGGVTPPPSNRSKAGRPPKDPSVPEGSGSPTNKPEKRKYTKRKRPDGTLMDIPLPSMEGGGAMPMPLDPQLQQQQQQQHHQQQHHQQQQQQLHHQQRPEEYIKAPPVKKRKPSRSPSPNYPPESAYTPEDLSKPPYNYAVLIFDALTEAGNPMTLKQIYRALKLKYPYFRFKCETEGWTSSVRHNLNGNNHLFMHAERDGKGWSWQLRPGASVEKEKKRRPSPPPSTQTSAATTSTPHYMPQMSHPYNPPAPAPLGMPPAHVASQNFQFPPYIVPPAPAAPNQNPTPTPAPPPAPPASSAHAHTPTPAPAPPQPQQQAVPVPPPSLPPNSFPPPPASFAIPSPIRNNLPPAFAQTIPSTYTSPYASDPPPQLAQFQQSQQQQQHQPLSALPTPQFQSPYAPTPALPPQQQQQQQQQYPPHPSHTNVNMQPPRAPAPGHGGGPPPPPPPPALQSSNPANPMAAPTDSSDASSFNERASKAIDDFEAVLMEDYEDKNYIREVLKSARARVLGDAKESSFPGGEPKDEAVILDALRNLIGSLKEG